MRYTNPRTFTFFRRVTASAAAMSRDSLPDRYSQLTRFRREISDFRSAPTRLPVLRLDRTTTTAVQHGFIAEPRRYLSDLLYGCPGRPRLRRTRGRREIDV